MSKNEDLKKLVHSHWEAETCGIRYGIDDLENTRYTLDPFIPAFADFEHAKGKKVLEIGVGAGVDFANWIKCGAIATGVDLTQAAINLTQKRISKFNIQNSEFKLQPADAENLPFPNNEFDIVYSWGVLHHTPDTPAAFAEAFRVLKSDGTLKAMIYHVPSWTGYLLWIRYCLLRGKPWKSPRQAIFEHLESPGTKAYTKSKARQLLHKIGFTNIHLETKLCAGDLLTIKPSKKYQSKIYKIFWKLYPRWFVKLMGNKYGLNLLIKAEKNKKSGTC